MPRERDFVSVIFPTYNASAFVAEAIASILAQTYSNFELLVIDNASSDNTLEIVEALQANDARIRILRNDSNFGLVYSLNRGLSESSGEFIARMDADDVAKVHRLQTQVSWLNRHPDHDACGTWFKYIDRETVIQTPTDYDSVLLYSLENNPFGHPTMLLRRRALQKMSMPLYRTDRYPAEDYDFWARLMRVSKGANIPEVLLDYRIHPHQISNQNPAQLAMSDVVRLETLRWLFPLTIFLPRSARLSFVRVLCHSENRKTRRAFAVIPGALALLSAFLFNRVGPRRTAGYLKRKLRP